MSVNAFGTVLDEVTLDPKWGVLTLSDAFDTGLQPAPVSPTGDSVPWKLLSGTVRYSLTTSLREGPEYENVYVAPSLTLGTSVFLPCFWQNVNVKLIW